MIKDLFLIFKGMKENILSHPKRNLQNIITLWFFLLFFFPADENSTKCCLVIATRLCFPSSIH